MFKIKKVIVGISGGVDSAVTALLLKQRGYNVHGVFMQNWDIADEKGYCSSDADYEDASLICDQLKINLTRVNFVKHYWNEVFCDLLRDYETGFTPNPDVLCNKQIKFKHFFEYATNDLGADAIATGHYARTNFGPYLEHYDPKKGARLYCGSDSIKDQSFFLCQIPQKALQKTMFPLGHLMKSEVKKIAADNGLKKIATKKESMGICFIGNRKFQDFIREYIEDKPGPFIDIDSGAVVGSHNGIHQYTLGQRSRLQTIGEPYFIGRKDVKNNIIYVVKGTKHPLLYTNIILTQPPFWIHSKPPDLELRNVLDCQFKFQHTKRWVDCQVSETDKGLVIKVDKYKRAITPGQFAILAKDDECLGSARIANAGVSHFALHYLENRQIRERSLDEFRRKKQDDELAFSDCEDSKLKV